MPIFDVWQVLDMITKNVEKVTKAPNSVGDAVGGTPP
jgi:hypothetical protein